MNYQFHYSVPMDEEMGILFGIAYAVILAVSLLVGLVFYAMRAYAVYSIAKRRGMRKPWLAWVPVANSWMLGALSDQYRHLIKGEIRQKRKLLLGFAIQFLVLKLCRILWKRRLFPGLVVLGIVAGELACQMITGWELLAVLVLYGCVFSLAIGAVLAFAVYCVAEHSKG